MFFMKLFLKLLYKFALSFSLCLREMVIHFI